MSSVISKPSREAASTALTQTLDHDLDKEGKRVLFDNKKLHQDVKFNKLMRNGVKNLNDIKSMKVSPNIALNTQLVIYRNNLTPFYNHKKINIVTEDDLRQGLKTFDVLSSKGNQSEMNQTMKSNGLNKTYISTKEFMNNHDETQVQNYMVGTVIERDVDKINAHIADKELTEAKLKELENREANIIHNLYSTHFVQKPTGGSPQR